MKCEHCGHELAGQENVCPMCGNEIVKKGEGPGAGKKPLSVRIGIAVAVVTVCLAAIVLFINQPGQKYKRYMRNARNAFEKGAYEEATEVYGKAFDVSGNEEALADMAKQYDDLLIRKQRRRMLWHIMPWIL